MIARSRAAITSILTDLLLRMLPVVWTSSRGSLQINKFYTLKTSSAALWDRYTKECSKSRQPFHGSERLLYTIFKEHNEIKQVGPTGHDVCDMCSALNLVMSKLEGLSDPASRAEHAKAVARIAAHNVFHSTERKYYDAASDRAAAAPEEIDHEDFGGEASVAIPHEFEPAARPLLPRHHLGELPVSGESLLVVDDELDHLPHLVDRHRK
mmetsp:Transcript_27147/g.87728  ORF Transcript_27147/g.87728 Transcript_27147/m.87728 type:complete len:210 (-) Transcript_27147:871-1500(-)